MNGSDVSGVTERERMEVPPRDAEIISEKTSSVSVRSVLKTILLPIGGVAGFLIATFPISLPAIYGLALLLLYYIK